MTPEREAYLAKCSKREWFLRRQMESCKRSLKFAKGHLGTEIVVFDNLLSKKELVRARIRELKYKITIYRHELNRLKGMDRVVVPVLDYMEEDEGDGNIVQVDAWRCPKCGTFVGGYCWETSTYCMQCGRRILWWKVK